jgi:hypothetical protein
MIMRTAARLCAALLAIGALAGCATLSSSPAGALGDAEQLKAMGEAETAKENWELAYRYISLIHILHPDSPQNREVFPLAAHLYRKSWAPHRTELDSVWTTSEPLFLFAWLAGFFQDANEFPQPQMDALFLGNNYQLFRDFLAYAANRPYIAQWKITAEKNNGIVESVTGTR